MRIIGLAVVFFLGACSLKTPTSNETLNHLDRAGIEKSSRLFHESIRMLTQHYYTDIEPEMLAEWAVERMLEKVNDHGYLQVAEVGGKCGSQDAGPGIGINFTRTKGNYTVIRVAPHSPAFSAGIELGDIILAINDKPAHLLSFEEIGFEIVCPKMMLVKITVLQNDMVVTKTIAKRESKFADLFATMLPQKIAYLYIYNLGDEELAVDALKLIKKMNSLGARAFVIDLRSMNGGIIRAGQIFLAGFLEPSSLILKSKSHKNGVPEIGYYTFDEIKPIREKPIVVLTNRFTASLGEVIAMALKSYGRATVIGEKTLGYGTVMKAFFPARDVMMFVPTGVSEGPHGEIFEGEGVRPDIEVAESNPFPPLQSGG